MNFEQFKRETAVQGVDGVTLRRDGGIYFPIVFQTRHDIGQYSSVELMTSEKTHEVALRLSTAKPSPTRAQLVRHGKNGCEANAASWVRLAESWDYPIGQSLGYSLHDGGLIVLQKEAATAQAEAKE